MAITPVLACYRTSDVATGGITAWQLTTGPDGPRTDVVARCPLGDAPWVTPYTISSSCCAGVIAPSASSAPEAKFKSSVPLSSKANGLVTAPSTPLGVSWPWPIAARARSNSSTYQTPPSQQSEASSTSAGAASSLDRWQTVKKAPCSPGDLAGSRPPCRHGSGI